jgi:hypothetical protein
VNLQERRGTLPSGPIVDGENERHGAIFVLRFLNALWDERIANLLQNKLTSGSRVLHRFGVPGCFTRWIAAGAS